VEADLPDRPSFAGAFFVAGPMANVGTAVVLASGDDCSGGHIVVVMNLAFAAVNLFPHGTSDGAKLCRLLRRRGADVAVSTAGPSIKR
jgi:Zn-dependent protease